LTAKEARAERQTTIARSPGSALFIFDPAEVYDGKSNMF